MSDVRDRTCEATLAGTCDWRQLGKICAVLRRYSWRVVACEISNTSEAGLSSSNAYAVLVIAGPYYEPGKVPWSDLADAGFKDLERWGR